MQSANYVSLSIEEKAQFLFVNKEILAPMVRASTTPLRTLALKYNADVVYSEEIVDRSICDCERRINNTLGTIDYVRKASSFSEKQLRKMGSHSSSELNLPVVVRVVPKLECDKLVFQIGTGDPILALEAAQAVEPDVAAIDINMGCPKKFSVCGGMGSALLKDTNRACDIIKLLRRNISTIPISAKIRLLKDTHSTIDFVKALEYAGVNAITIHAREVEDDSTKPASWDRLGNIVSSLSVPTIVNGDMYTREDISALKAKSGADSIMLARPALYNTSIFRTRAQKHSEDNTESGKRKSGSSADDYPNLLLTKDAVIQDYLREAIRWEANPQNVKYVVCEMMSNRRAPINRVISLPQNFPQGQTIASVCACKTLPALCKLWDVNMNLCGKGIATSDQRVQISGSALSKSIQVTATEQTYSDSYFLEPEKFRRQRPRIEENNL
mmetsp:Transcript_13820/g.19804  ORF Transcript_13820/g.19804 Transcript_13820/m.19804 type:complete len:442 (-) Transcript_13820:70-1395(-)